MEAQPLDQPWTAGLHEQRDRHLSRGRRRGRRGNHGGRRAADAGGRSLPPICMGKKEPAAAAEGSSPSFKGAVFQLLVLPSFRPVGQVLRESIGEERGSRPSSAICQSLAVCKVCRNSGPPHVLRHKVHLALVALIVGTRLACSIVVDESRDGPGATEIQGGPPGRGYVFVDIEISMRSLYS